MNLKTTSAFVRRFSAYFVALLLLTNNVSAQHWTELGGHNALGADSTIYSICSDGSGNIYAGGTFNYGPHSFYIAEYDSAHWTLWGNIFNGPVYNVYAPPFGPVYAGGAFTNSSGDPYVVRFNSGWAGYGLNNDFNNAVGAICSDPFGKIYAAGAFTNGQYYMVVGLSSNTWSQVGTSALSANGPIYSLCSDDSGHIYAAGDFTNYFHSPIKHRYVAKWDGSIWSELAGTNELLADSTIYSLCTDTSGNIYAAGAFTNGDGYFYVAKWNGSAWAELGGISALAANGSIASICSDPSGNIYAAGSFTNSSGKFYLAKWDGNAWSEYSWC